MGKQATSFGPHDILVYSNEVIQGAASAQSNLYRTFGNSFHMVFIENVATDLGSNDYFVTHVGGGTNTGDGMWFISNICIASGAEDCYDFDMAERETSAIISEDVKAIANVGSGQPLSGYSDKTGSGSLCYQGGHEGKYIWIVGNICMGWDGSGTTRHTNLGNIRYDQEESHAAGDGKDFMQVSGNVMITDGQTGRYMVIDQYMSHNTFLATSTSSTIQIRDSNEVIPYANQSFDYNLVYANSGNSNELVDWRGADAELSSRDNNWYGDGTGRDISNGDTLSQLQIDGFDLNSDEGDVVGISFPTIATYPNPEDWWDASFQADITPGGAWGGCATTNTPGAKDCSGNDLGWEINSMDSGFCGWAGLPIVAIKLAALGVTGNCIGNWDS